METSIVGVGVGITDRFRTVVEDKAARIEHLAPRAQRVDIKVTHRAYHNGRMEDDTVELTLTGKGPIVRAEATDADKFDNLAKVALSKQITSENEAKQAEPTIASQSAVVEQLKTGVQQMHDKLDQLISKRDELVARAKTADAQQQVHDAVKSINVLDPTSELGRFEDKVRRQEAQVAGQQELDASSLDSQFESLDDLGTAAEVDTRLAALKAGTAPKAVTSGE